VIVKKGARMETSIPASPLNTLSSAETITASAPYGRPNLSSKCLLAAVMSSCLEYSSLRGIHPRVPSNSIVVWTSSSNFILTTPSKFDSTA